MSFIKNKEESLKRLKDLCSQTKVVGWCSNMWFIQLRNTFPIEFLAYTQNTNKYPNTRTDVKEKFINSISLRIQEYLSYPLEDIDVELLNSISEQIKERLFQKQSLESLNN